MTDLQQQTDALRHDAGVTKQDAHTIGARLLATAYPPAALQAALEWDEDVHTYGLPEMRALQEMAQNTPYSRREWITAWTNSSTYRRAIRHEEIPDLTAWLARISLLAKDQPLLVAVWGADVIDGWQAEINAFIRSPAMKQVVTAVENMTAAFAALWYTLDPSRCHHNPQCPCRPAPFPAARDYHRRTRHRRRRQR